jgi:DNA repair photolyase
LGRKCLEAVLSEPGWTVRVLTKNAAVAKDFDLVEKYKDRVLVGLSITATHEKNDIIAVVEPNASPIAERLEVLQQAHSRGLRTYGMLCPLLPGVADSPAHIDELVKYMVGCGVEEIFAEAVMLQRTRIHASQWLTVDDVAADLKLSKSIVYRIIRNGEMTAITSSIKS